MFHDDEAGALKVTDDLLRGYGRHRAPGGLVQSADTHYVWRIEFRPNDLASARYASD